MSEEEKLEIALDLARQNINLEKVEETMIDLYKDLRQFLDLAEKNKRILDKYDKEAKDT